mmetsp:Transcript_78706/g.157381  ORF Transcript_78706/g.157381 Transcript_78706/m.157381 type:complete len:153 (-) Transcript_78706:37-495(-)
MRPLPQTLSERLRGSQTQAGWEKKKTKIGRCNAPGWACVKSVSNSTGFLFSLSSFLSLSFLLQPVRGATHTRTQKTFVKVDFQICSFGEEPALFLFLIFSASLFECVPDCKCKGLSLHPVEIRLRSNHDSTSEASVPLLQKRVLTEGVVTIK